MQTVELGPDDLRIEIRRGVTAEETIAQAPPIEAGWWRLGTRTIRDEYGIYITVFVDQKLPPQLSNVLYSPEG